MHCQTTLLISFFVHAYSDLCVCVLNHSLMFVFALEDWTLGDLDEWFGSTMGAQFTGAHLACFQKCEEH